ncbi:hypothetical protein Q8G81_35700, partial [Klebsiella pneumoniae]
MQERWDQFQHIKARKAQLYMYNSVKALRYSTIPGRDVQMGKFSVMLYGTEENIDVSPDWVMEHFRPQVVHSVLD